jgi:hypothetical protein
MATNWHLRRSMVNYSEKIEDASERLKYHIARNNYIDKIAVETLMTSLPTMSLPQINAAIERADTTRTVADTLLVLLKNEKKRKETNLRLTEKNEDAEYKAYQRQNHVCDLTTRANPYRHRWTLPTNQDNAMDEN